MGCFGDIWGDVLCCFPVPELPVVVGEQPHAFPSPFFGCLEYVDPGKGVRPCVPWCCPVAMCCSCCIVGANYSLMIGEDTKHSDFSEIEAGDTGCALCLCCCLLNLVILPLPVATAILERRYIMNRYGIPSGGLGPCACLLGVCFPCAFFQHYAFLRSLAHGKSSSGGDVDEKGGASSAPHEATSFLSKNTEPATGYDTGVPAAAASIPIGRPDSGVFERAERAYVIAEDEKEATGDGGGLSPLSAAGDAEATGVVNEQPGGSRDNAAAVEDTEIVSPAGSSSSTGSGAATSPKKKRGSFRFSFRRKSGKPKEQDATKRPSGKR